MSTVLVTGFGPYGNTPTNPAQAVAEGLGGTTLDGAQVVGQVVPCVFFEAIKASVAAIEEVRPEIVVMPSAARPANPRSTGFGLTSVRTLPNAS